jgi:ankyrin repeat protein
MVSKGYLEDLRNMINQNTSLTLIVDNLGNTLLHIAAAAGRDIILEYLLMKGADKLINNKNHVGDTPLHKAAMRNQSDAIRILLKRGADPKITNKEGKIPSDLTNHEDVQHLLDVEVEIKNNDSDDE